MTKEELISKASKLAEFSVIGTDAYRDILNFFESNICIPKGDNRHPDAELLHKAIENNSIILECANQLNPWEEVASFHKFTFRIKPSEPAWEYQWVEMAENTAIDITTTYYTEQEMLDDNCWVKIEETKRERKQ